MPERPDKFIDKNAEILESRKRREARWSRSALGCGANKCPAWLSENKTAE
jgi:hypothetical protein